MPRFARRHWFTLKKTASYYVMHIAVAAAVAYAVTGSLVTAIALSLLEPTVQAVAFFFHEKAWARDAASAAAGQRCAGLNAPRPPARRRPALECPLLLPH